MGYIILSAIVVLIINGIAASKYEKIAAMKGHSGYFWYCFLLGIVGWLMVVALPDQISKEELAESISKLSKNEESARYIEKLKTTYDDDRLPPI